MRRLLFVRLGRAAAICALLAGSAHAHAQEPVVTPPKVVTSVDADDPRPSGDRVTVELELEIDTSGAVTSARVLRSSGSEDVDAAALDAARKLGFEPATRDGTPVGARIRYEYVFPAKQPPPPPPPILTGAATDRETKRPLANARVVVTTDTGETFTTTTDAQGTFRVEGVPPGPVHVTIAADGYTPARLDETLEPGTATDAKLALDPEPDPEAFTATARVEAPPREVTKRTLEREEMAKLPGTRGDPLRGVELLPGVARPSPFGPTVPILRGANRGDSQVFMDGAPVPLLFHFGNLNSFVHSRVLDSVDVYPSNFSVRYGRKVGGVIEAKLRDPRTDGVHGVAEASLLDLSLLAEAPVTEKISVLAAARRSIVDTVLNSAQNTADLSIEAAPVYWDYQAIAAFKPTDADRIRLLAYGSSDRFAIVNTNPGDGDPALRGGFDLRSVFHRVQLGYRHRWSGGSEQNTELTYGRTEERGVFGAVGVFDMNVDTLQGRSEWVGVVSPAVRLVAGADVLANRFHGSYHGVPPDTDEGEQPRALSTQRRVGIDASQWVFLPGAYVEAGVRPFRELLVVPGVRADYNDLLDEAAIDPRLSLRLDATDTTAIKAGVGRFSQSPDERHVVAPIGNPDLGMTHAIHASAGVEQRFGEAVTASLEGFAKKVDGVVIATPDGREPYFTNDGEGRMFGGELFVRVKPTGRFFGFLSYTLTRSERRSPGEDWRLFERDMPHTVNAVGVYRLGRGWELGATIRYTSGSPYTPVTSATYDATTDVYQPRLGRPFSARNPAFSRVDLRIQKTWTFSRWSLSAYLDVQNVMNSPNREGFNYSYDYRIRESDRGLPLLPILGLRGEL